MKLKKVFMLYIYFLLIIDERMFVKYINFVCNFLMKMLMIIDCWSYKY